MGTAFACPGSSAATTTQATSATGNGAVVATPVRNADTRAPSPKDADAIAEAVRDSEYTAAVPKTNYEVTGTVLAASDPSWAFIELEPTVGDLDRAEGVVHRTPAGWELVQLGTAEVGCDVAPSAVLDDFGLQCPPPEGTTTAPAADDAQPA